MHTAYISIGSNLGSRKNNIRKALKELELFSILDSCSKPRRTRPYGYTEQPDFINMVVRIKTGLNPYELLEKLQAIENRLGRIRKKHWAERTIDLDILFFDDLIIRDEKLIVPHPDLQNRFFVLEPLLDIDSDYSHPVLKRNIRELIGILRNKSRK